MTVSGPTHKSERGTQTSLVVYGLKYNTQSSSLCQPMTNRASQQHPNTRALQFPGVQMIEKLCAESQPFIPADCHSKQSKYLYNLFLSEIRMWGTLVFQYSWWPDLIKSQSLKQIKEKKILQQAVMTLCSNSAGTGRSKAYLPLQPYMA